jgi:D-galactose 1-dehydrogenase
MTKTRIAIVGLGKIARDQHISALAASDAFELVGKGVPELRGSEYPDLYAHFAGIVRGRSIDVDVSPLQLVADAFLCGQRKEVEPFVE